MDYIIAQTKPEAGYELLDSGDGEKLERYGAVVVARPDPQALWPKLLPETQWSKAQAFFSPTAPGREADPSLGRRGGEAVWKTRGEVSERWQIDFGKLKLWIKLSAFKHTGVFPEQASNWEWIRERVIHGSAHGNNRSRPVTTPANKPRVLNLFGYTGGASLAAAQAGAEVVHVDGSKVAIGWARDNAEISGLSDKPIRWILDDAFAFVKREIRRGNKYDGIIMDPPAFGHGPKKELWKIEESFLPFLDACRQVLSDKPLFFLINGYAAGYSALAYKNNLDELLKKYGGTVEVGELTIAESKSERLLPAGIFARWFSN